MDGIAAHRARLGAALTAGRIDDLARIDFALRQHGITGIHGEAEVGVTTLVEHALRMHELAYIRLDLDAVASEGDAAQALARGIARLRLNPLVLSQLRLPDGLRSTTVDQAFLRFATDAGSAIADLVRTDQPREDVSIDHVLSTLATLYAGEQAPAIWIDHLEAPASTARHPLDVNALLWNVRSLQQRLDTAVVISGHRAATPVAYGRDGAFHGDGEWVTIGRPDLQAWTHAAAAVDESAPDADWLPELARLTRGHPPTLLLALSLRAESPVRARTPSQLWEFLLALDDGLVESALRHARALHRLGPRTLAQIARGSGPYENATNATRRKEINRAVKRLHEAGLITQPRPRAWEVTNPLIDGRLRTFSDG